MSVELVKIPGGSVWHRVLRETDESGDDTPCPPMLLCRTLVLHDLMVHARGTFDAAARLWRLGAGTGRPCSLCERIMRKT